MRILYFSQAYTPHDYRFLSTILEAGHEPFFLRLITDKSSETRPLPGGTTELHWSGSLRRLVNDIKPDLIHAGSLDTCSYLAAKRGFRPLVQMSWGSDILFYAKRSAFVRGRVSYALKKGNALICDCEAVRSAALKLGFPNDLIVTFPWGVDLKQFSPGKSALRSKLGWQNAFVLLHMRSWEKLYGVETVLRAFLRAAKTQPRLRLLMLGTGSLAPRFKQLVARSGLADNVHFPGQISQQDLPDYYRAADIYVSASLSDGSSVSLMEAMASGLPALVTDIPGNREWVSDEKEGWLFSVSDETQLADKIVSAMQASGDLKKMAKQARHTAEERADWQRNKAGLAKAYQIALQKVG